MKNNTLKIIGDVAQKQFGNRVSAADIETFFGQYTKGMLLFPGNVKNRFSLDVIETYKFLTELAERDILQICFRLYCDKCQKTIAFVDVFNKIPDVFVCESCHRKMSGLENTLVIFKIVRDD